MLLASLAFQQGVSGYTGTVDTMLQEDNPTANNSMAGSLEIDSGTDKDAQVLLRFDNVFGVNAGQILPGSTILSANLELQVRDAGDSIALHRMLQNWADTDTWNSLVNGVQADDVEASFGADVTTGSVATGLFLIDVTGSLQTWSGNPAGNFGWALLPTGSESVDFDSAEGATPPRLVVSYATGSLPLITIAATDNSGSEVGPDNGVFTVLRSGDATGDLIVNYTVSGTATAGTDYNSLSGSVTIPDGSVSASFVVTPIDDSDAEGSETAIATLSTSTAYYVGSSYFDTVTIADNEAALTVSIQAPSISEGADDTTATVSRNSNTTNPLVVNLQSDDLTEATVPATVTIPAGQTTSPSFNINSVDDRIVDGNQTVTITASETGHSSGSDTLDVTDDDVAGLHESCLDYPGPLVTLSGSQSSLYDRDVEPNTKFDATDATWYATGTTRIEIEGGSNLCWQGGLVEHNWPADQDWETTHGDHGFKFRNTPNLVVEDVRIKTAGDGISMYEGTEDFLIRGVYMEDIRDDAIEHDWLGGGTIEDTFINGAYVAFAARSRESVDVDGSDNTWVIKDTLAFLRPQIGVYKGPVPGYGRFFKWEDLGPKLEIHNSIFRADQLPDHENLGIPAGKLVSSSNNIVVWRGEGDPPALPAGFTLTQDMSVWDNAVLQWRIDHGLPVSPPVINGQTFTLDENSANGTLVGTVVASDVDAGQTLSYTITSANTGGTFAIDSSSGQITVANSAMLDYELTPRFNLVVQVSDDGTPSLSNTAIMTIDLNDVNENPYSIAEARVQASSDDAEERATGNVQLTSSDLELVFDISDQTVGTRFSALDVPRGANILNAYIQFQADETSTVATSLTIEGEATDDALAFTTSSRNISSRARTNASVAWSPAPWTTQGTAAPDQRTTDIASLIQEIVDRPGWSAGNSLAVIITGTGKRVAESYEGDPSGAPLLHVEYTTPTALPPTVTGEIVNGASANRSGIAELSLEFDRAVMVSPVTALRVHNHTTGNSTDLSAATLHGNGTSTVTWDLSSVNLPNGRYTAELPATATTNAGGLPLASTHTYEFYILQGDVNGDGAVNFADYGVVGANFDPLPGNAYRPGDANGDGLVNFADYGVVGGNFNPLGISALTYDLGDAPQASTNYPTTLANNGAVHVIGLGLFLGASVDSESDGQPHADALGDDTAGGDEDGVTFGSLTAGSTANITVVAAVPSSAVLNAWVDFSADGDWSDLGEQIFTNEPLVNSSNALSFSIPAGAAVGDTFARFRVTTSAGYSYTGLAPDGEVEDYKINIGASAAPGAAQILFVVNPPYSEFEYSVYQVESVHHGQLSEYLPQSFVTNTSMDVWPSDSFHSNPLDSDNSSVLEELGLIDNALGDERFFDETPASALGDPGLIDTVLEDDLFVDQLMSE